MPSRAANTTSSKQPRYRCPVCGQYPTLTTRGALRNHSYPWYHSQSGSHCSGSGSQVLPLEGQTSLTDLPRRTEEPCGICGKPIIIYPDIRWREAPDDKTPLICTERGSFHQDCYYQSDQPEESQP